MQLSEKLLQLNNVSVNYGGVRALERANLYLNNGETVLLLGPNGAGKSTVLKAIFGLAPINHGEIFWREKTISPTPFQMSELGIAYVPQGRRVFTNLTVKENLTIGAVKINDKNEIQRRLEEVYKIFSTLKTKNKLPAGYLSGGEQQMLAIGRAFMSGPKVLLLDEPSLGLSTKMVKEVFSKIKEINIQYHTSILIVEHNLKSALMIANRAYILDKGRVVGSTKNTNINNAVLEKIFL